MHCKFGSTKTTATHLRCMHFLGAVLNWHCKNHAGCLRSRRHINIFILGAWNIAFFSCPTGFFRGSWVKLKMTKCSIYNGGCCYWSSTALYSKREENLSSGSNTNLRGYFTNKIHPLLPASIKGFFWSLKVIISREKIMN